MMNKYITNLSCIKCGQIYPVSPETYTCADCGLEGILDVNYDYIKIQQTMNLKSLKSRPDNLWKFEELLPIIPEDATRLLSLNCTPIYYCPELEHFFGSSNIYVKDDGRLPTASFKDRASSIGVLLAKEAKKSIISCSSTGNAASSLAGFAAKTRLKSVIFVPKRAPEPKVTQLMVFGARVIKVDGTYSDTYNFAQKAIEKYGWYNRNCAINPYLVEGKKTCGLEIAEQMADKIPDWVVVSVGDGCTISGICKGLIEMKKIGIIDKVPRVLGVQAELSDALYKAWKNGKDLEEGPSSTFADSIAVGYPRNWRKAIKYVNEINGIMVAVSDELIRLMLMSVPKMTGVFAEPAAAASFAGLKKAYDEKIINSNESVLVVVTGNGLKDIQSTINSVGTPPVIKPNFNFLEGEIGDLL